MCDRVRPFVYLHPPRKGRPFRPWAVRDAMALREIELLLVRDGHQAGDPVINHANSRDLLDLASIDATVLLATIRLGLDDLEAGIGRPIIPSGSNLERVIFDEMRHYFTDLSRSKAELAPWLADRLPELFLNRGSMLVRAIGGAEYLGVKRLGKGPFQDPPAPNLTPVFFIHTPPLWDGGPELIIAFGMSSIETLVWARLIRKRFPHLITSRTWRYVMGELTVGDVPTRPRDYAFADTWDSQIILDVPLLDDGAASSLLAAS